MLNLSLPSAPTTKSPPPTAKIRSRGAVDAPRSFATEGPAGAEARTYDIGPAAEKFIGVVIAGQGQSVPPAVRHIEVVLNRTEELVR